MVSPEMETDSVAAADAISSRTAETTRSAISSPDAWVVAVVLSWARTTVSVLPLLAVTFTISVRDGGASIVA